MPATLRTVAAGTLLLLICGAARAQTAPSSPADATPPGPPAQSVPPPPAPSHGQGSDLPAGQLIQLPDGSYVIAEPGGGEAATATRAGGGEGEFSGMQAMPMHQGHRPPPSRGASFHFHGPNLNVDVKCADSEPTKVCVDAASELLDKVRAEGKP